MTEVTNEMLYEELLKLDQNVAKTEEALTDLVSFMKEMNRELAEGQAKTDALKQKLFKGDLIMRGCSLVEVSPELLQELLRRLHQRADKSERMAREFRNELNSMRLNLHAHQSDLNNLYAMHSQLDERMERIDNRLELRELSEAQARFEPHP